MAEVAEPLNHFNPTAEDVKIAMKITPETYSGVAVVTIAPVESERSSREPSRIPAKTPMISAPGIITIITQNINLPVSARRVLTTSKTGSLNTLENPQLPCKTRTIFRCIWLNHAMV